jgi:hypothetical protein
MAWDYVISDTDRGGKAREARLDSPSLSMSHISTSFGEKFNQLTGSHRRTAHALSENIRGICEEFGVEFCGFLTLTFADDVICIKEAQRRFNSLNTHVLSRRYSRIIGVWERQRNMRIHFHLVVVLASDIRTGFSFADLEYKQGRARYASASRALKAEWSFWRRTAKKYGFGRTELLPVKSTTDGIARYVGKYISMHVIFRVEEDKGAKVVRYIGFKDGTRRACSKFGWNNDSAKLWRAKCKIWAHRNGYSGPDDVKDLVSRLRGRRSGSRWAYLLQDAILATDIYGPDVVWSPDGTFRFISCPPRPCFESQLLYLSAVIDRRMSEDRKLDTSDYE